MEQVEEKFRGQLFEAIQKSGFESARQLSLDCDLSAASINSWLNPPNSDNHKTHGPGAFALARACRKLGTSPNAMLGFRDRTGWTVNDAIARYESGGGSLEAFSEMLDFVDVYKQPAEGDKRIVITHLGKKSLASRLTGVRVKWIFQLTMDGFMDQVVRKKILEAYIATGSQKVALSIESLTSPVQIRYQRLLLSVTDKNDEKLVLNYSSEIADA